jgi:hypothetical protein
MTLQLHSEFPDIWGKFDFFFISVMVTKILLLDEVTMPPPMFMVHLGDSSETKEPSCGYSLQTSGYPGEVKGLPIHDR